MHDVITNSISDVEAYANNACKADKRSMVKNERYLHHCFSSALSSRLGSEAWGWQTESPIIQPEAPCEPAEGTKSAKSDGRRKQGSMDFVIALHTDDGSVKYGIEWKGGIRTPSQAEIDGDFSKLAKSAETKGSKFQLFCAMMLTRNQPIRLTV